MNLALWIAIGFLAGSLPFSPWLVRRAAGADVRQFGDRNPGATNAMKAGGRGVGLAALLLDAFKGAIPVGLAFHAAGLTGWEVVAVGIAPILGHAFSPFLAGHGGKGVATTFGVWAGLTGPDAPIVLGLLLGLLFVVVDNSGWAIVLAMLGLLAHLINVHPDPAFIGLWTACLALSLWKYRADLARAPGVRAGVLRQAARWAGQGGGRD